MRFATRPLGIMAVVFLVGAVPSLARAELYDFTANDNGYSISGTLTTLDTANANGSYQIVGISGTYLGPDTSGSITSLIAPGGYPAIMDGANDNELFVSTLGVPGAGTYLDDNGFSFTVGAVDENLFYDTPNNHYQIFNAETYETDVTFTLAADTAAVPEPTSILSVFSGGLILAGYAWRRRRALGGAIGTR